MKDHGHNFLFRPPRLALLLLGVSLTLHAAITPIWRWGLATLLPGALLAVSGQIVMIWAWALFRRAETPICPSDTPTMFVVTGPYRFTRNPMYLGILAFLVGAAVSVGTWPMTIAPVTFLLVITRYSIPFEEQQMEAQFGESYRAYRRQVRRWI